jgi:hypothetical protein
VKFNPHLSQASNNLPYPKKKWYYPRKKTENQKVNTCYKKKNKKKLKEKVDGYT